MAFIEKSVEVAVPVRTAYDQWTQFEEFPKFMEGVKAVVQIDDLRLHWTVEIAGKAQSWTAEITAQQPDTRIAWQSLSGAKNGGVVTFHKIDDRHCKVSLSIEYDPQGVIQTVGDKLGFVDRKVEGDLERFKKFIESRGSESGAWRGEVTQAVPDHQ